MLLKLFFFFYLLHNRGISYTIFAWNPPFLVWPRTRAHVAKSEGPLPQAPTSGSM
jgi:hypothetical protein